MPLNRRIVLKTLLMSPFFGVARKVRASAIGAPTVPGTVNILLNGLFFLEVDKANKLLLISAPKVRDHTFLAGTRQNLQPSTGFDWSPASFGLTGKDPTFSSDPDIPTDITNSILQFTKNETGVGPLKTDPSLYFGKVILPWPLTITPLRIDHLPAFDPSKTNVGPKIKARCGSQIADVICLQYNYQFSGPVLPPTNPTTNFHLHMLCCKDSDGSVQHINDALTDAAGTFTNQGKFDLRMQGAVQPTTIDQPPPITGVSPEDERAAIEDGACRGSQGVGASSMKNHPSSGRNEKMKNLSSNPKGTKKTAASQANDGGTVEAENVSPANCPSFFLG
jgi:hypothetical protein